jgi:molybdopterin-guanine dinucleotide biosynthesis protein A
MAIPVSQLTAILLTGGRSQRMGQDKAFLPWGLDDTPLWLVQLQKLHALNPAHLCLSSRHDQNFPKPILAPLHAEIISDPEPGRGPLTAFLACHTDFILPLAVDMPAVTPLLLQQLIAQADPRCGLVFHDPRRDRFQPFPAIYPRPVAALARDRLDRGELSLQNLIRTALEKGLLHSLPLEAKNVALFKNVNSPEDIEPPPRPASPAS